VASTPLTSLETAVRQIARALDQAGRTWALVGGLAVSARAEPRTTRDVDIAVAVLDDQDAESLVFALQAVGYDVTGAIEQDTAGRLATVRLQVVGEKRKKGIVVDLLFASSGVEGEIASAAERLQILPGLDVPVALTGHLIALKVLSRDDVRRPRDAEDLRGLLVAASPRDLKFASDLLRLVTRRGFHRGKVLEDELDRAIAELAS
jgi:Nucleotidyl transferase AbiEii toxin, Type IV TA system